MLNINSLREVFDKTGELIPSKEILKSRNELYEKK